MLNRLLSAVTGSLEKVPEDFQDDECKQQINYKNILMKMVNSKRYRQLRYQMEYFADFRTDVVDHLLFMTLYSRSVAVKISSLDLLLEKLNKILMLVKYHQLSVEEFYYYVYNVLMDEDNLEIIMRDIHNAFLLEKISMREHFQASYVPLLLDNIEQVIAIKSSQESGYKCKKSDTMQPWVLQKIISESHVIPWIKDAIQAENNESMDEDLINLLSKLEQIPENDLKQCIAAINSFDNLSQKLTEKLNEQSILNYIVAFLDYNSARLYEEDIEFSTIKMTENQRTIFDKKYSYEKIAKDTCELYTKFKENKELEISLQFEREFKTDKEKRSLYFQRDEFLIDYLHHITRNTVYDRLYLIAYFQIILKENLDSNPFPRNMMDKAILQFSSIVTSILSKPHYSAEALTYIAEPALNMLVNLSDPRVLGNIPQENALGYRAPYYTTTSRLIKSHASLDYNLIKKIQGRNAVKRLPPDGCELDKRRKNLLKEITVKKEQYVSDLQNLILIQNPDEMKPREIEKLLLRIASVNYLKEQILFCDELIPAALKENMLNLFDELAFEPRSRYCYSKSHVTKLVEKMNFKEFFKVNRIRPAIKDDKEVKVNVSTLTDPPLQPAPMSMKPSLEMASDVKVSNMSVFKKETPEVKILNSSEDYIDFPRVG